MSQARPRVKPALTQVGRHCHHCPCTADWATFPGAVRRQDHMQAVKGGRAAGLGCCFWNAARSGRSRSGSTPCAAWPTRQTCSMRQQGQGVLAPGAAGSTPPGAGLGATSWGGAPLVCCVWERMWALCSTNSNPARARFVRANTATRTSRPSPSSQHTAPRKGGLARGAGRRESSTQSLSSL